MIKPIVEFVESFTITGFSTRTQNKDECDLNTAKIPSLWQKFYASDLVNNTPVFGVYSDYASDVNDFYTLTVGIDAKPSDLNQVTIHSGHYLVFKARGPMPITIINLWQKIWQYFETEKQYQRSYLSDFERYDPSEQVAIYIGVR